MKTRIHLVLDETEKARFRRQAAKEGKTLSGWLRGLARDRIEREGPPRLDTMADLHAFFRACDARETGSEPDWEQHRRVIERSKRSGAAES